jgi:hypothetical protein
MSLKKTGLTVSHHIIFLSHAVRFQSSFVLYSFLVMFKGLSESNIMIMRYENIRLQRDFPGVSSRNKSGNRRGKFFNEACHDLFYKFVTT